ncbi:MAG: hypothetical protein AB7S74_19035 [Hyphomicrobium sp.]
MSYAYTYNNANRLKTVSQSGNLIGTYAYNGREQLTTRVITNSGSANGTTYFVHDQWGNIIAELDATGATVREYIWMPEAEIAPTRGSRTTVDRPVAVISNVATTPALLMVHVDQLNRPVKMTDATGAVVWSALYSPFGGAYTLSGSETLNARFPGQWFQMEAGLHYIYGRLSRCKQILKLGPWSVADIYPASPVWCAPMWNPRAQASTTGWPRRPM